MAWLLARGVASRRLGTYYPRQPVRNMAELPFTSGMSGGVVKTSCWSYGCQFDASYVGLALNLQGCLRGPLRYLWRALLPCSFAF